MQLMTAGGEMGKQQDLSGIVWVPGIPEPDFKTLFEWAPEPCLILNQELAIVAVNSSYLRDIAAGRADLVGQGIFDIVPDPAAGQDVAGRPMQGLRASLERVRHACVADTMTVHVREITRPQSQGGGVEIRYWRPVNSPVLDAHGGLSYIIHQLVDVTEYLRPGRHEVGQRDLTDEAGFQAAQVDAEILARSRELQEAYQALRVESDAKNQFLAQVSHELRTPLNTILGFGELLSFSDISAEHREWMSMMTEAAKHLRQLLDEVLDISRIEAGQLSLSIEAVDVEGVITDALEVIRPLAISRGVHLDPPPRLPSSQYVAADLQRLRQVLLNLLSNAIKYNHPAGRVTIAVDHQTGGRIRISVHDTGRGIPEGQLGKLFVPFERLDAAQAGIEGTGLGLALSRQIIQTMGGASGVLSTDGKGSSFWIELPVTEPIAFTQAAVGHDPIVASREYATPKTVLYVEDMVENLRLAEQILKQRPSTTLIPAMFAGVALDLARQHRPDLILLDLHLPDMPGQEVMHQLRADPATCDIPIVILSGEASQTYIDRILAAGANAYLTKPIRVRQLLQLVDQFLGEPSAEARPDIAPRAAEATMNYPDSGR
jgi:signal transduction histidine kinase/ActR/RegA family two-component response regulator